LATDACDILRTHPTKQVTDMLVLLRFERSRVVERVDETQVWIFLVSIYRSIRRLDV
jgi:hypothetical protein